MTITSKQKTQLKRQAHTLKPVIQIGKKGLTQQQLFTIENHLRQHQLIKIKFNQYKQEKDHLSHTIAQQTNSTIIDLIGNTLILYKPKQQ